MQLRLKLPAAFGLAQFLKPYRWYVGIGLAGAFGEALADLLQPWPLKVLFDYGFRHRALPSQFATWLGPLTGSQPEGLIYVTLGAVLAIAGLSAAGSFAQDYFMPRIGHWVLHDMRRQLYWHVQRLSLAYHDKRRMGDLLSTLTSDIPMVRDMIESALVGLFVNTLTVTGMIGIMLAMDWRFALLGLSVTPLLAVTIFQFTRRIKKASRVVRKQEGAVASVAQEVLSSIHVVQAFTREDYEQARFEHENEQRVAAGIRARTLQAQMKPTIELLVGAGTVLVLFYGARQVLSGALLPGALLVFLAYLTRLYRPIKELSKQVDVVSRAMIGFERISSLLETERTVRDLPGARAASAFAGTIAFENVSFAYGTNAQPVISDVSFRVNPGETLAIVGSTGAGKSTLVSLIPRFNDPSRGRVLIDGHDIRDYTLASLRNQISLVLQDTVLFYGSVRDNIAYGRADASPEEILAAALAANAHEFIKGLPAGYDTIIGERGVTLSGGQRQRIAIARAMIRNAPIVLLDEPTTALDATSEALVLEGLARLTAGRTTIVIAHRLTTIARANNILVLEHGRIVESGTHSELLEAGGRYSELAHLQLKLHIPGALAL